VEDLVNTTIRQATRDAGPSGWRGVSGLSYSACQ
jgi:hypothetical protein